MFVFQVRRDEKAEFSLLVKQALKNSLHSAVPLCNSENMESDSRNSLPTTIKHHLQRSVHVVRLLADLTGRTSCAGMNFAVFLSLVASYTKKGEKSIELVGGSRSVDPKCAYFVDVFLNSA